MSTTTFVFVTPRRWDGKRDWEQKRRAEQEWENVRVLDADDIEQALEETPAVRIWLSELLEMPVHGVGDYWGLVAPLLYQLRTDSIDAARHGREPIKVNVSLEEDGLRVSVDDRGSGFDPTDETTRGKGWGVKLVEALASDWGVEQRDEGTEVWFKV
jgi:signal transduction histidine kinase